MSVKIYKASAGTGKTQKLVEDFLKELGLDRPNANVDEERLVDELRKTVVVTFTNFAVKEIKSRIMGEILNKLNEDERKFRRIWLKSMPRIQTFHSFIFDLLNSFKIEMKLPNDIKFIDKDSDYMWEEIVEKTVDLDKFDKVKTFLEGKVIGERNFKRFLKKFGKEIYYAIFLSSHHKWKIFYKEYNKEKKGEKKFEIPTELREILEHCWEFYENFFRINGVIDFDSGLFLFVKFLIEESIITGDLAQSWRNFYNILKNKDLEFVRIFFDEVQDNSFVEMYFIERMILFSENYEKSMNIPQLKVFIAGDYKQSIYIWRDAHPFIFKGLTNYFGEYVEHLKKSKRVKNEKLIDDINLVCKKMHRERWKLYDMETDKLSADDDILEKGKNYDYGIVKIVGSRVKFEEYGNEHKKEDIPSLSLDNAIIDFVKFLGEKRENKLKIGLLARNRSHLSELEKNLEKRLFSDGNYEKVYRVGKHLDLSKKFKKIIIKFLSQLSHGVFKDFKKNSNSFCFSPIYILLYRVKDRLEELKEEDIKKLIYIFYEIFDENSKSRGLSFLTCFESIVNRIQRRNLYTLPEKEWVGDRDKIDKILEFNTVHSSKGLTYDVVFLYDWRRKKNDKDFGQINFEFEIVYNQKGEFEFCIKVNCPKNLNEDHNLLYVAITRAKYKVYIFTPEGKK